MACVCEVDARPYLFPLPSELSAHQSILKRLGVAQAFTSKDYIGVLQAMALQYSASPAILQSTALSTPTPTPTPAALRSTPLPPRALDLAITLIQKLSDALPPSQPHSEPRPAGAPAAPTIYVPDALGVLTPAQNCTLDDAPWVREEASAPGTAAVVLRQSGVPGCRYRRNCGYGER